MRHLRTRLRRHPSPPKPHSGSGSSHLSPRNMAVAEGLNEQGMATLLFDLLMLEEEADRANVFDIRLLAERVIDAALMMS